MPKSSEPMTDTSPKFETVVKRLLSTPPKPHSATKSGGSKGKAKKVSDETKRPASQTAGSLTKGSSATHGH